MARNAFKAGAMSEKRLARLALSAVRRERASLDRPDTQRGLAHEKMPELAGNRLALAMLMEQRPLLDPQRKLIVVFSPKSACSSVVIWFFKLIGHAKAARNYDPWPHNYRIDVYYRSALYFRALLDDLPRYRVIRVVRNSYERVAGSFRHALAHGYADGQIAKALPGHGLGEHSLSFREFLDFLETEDLETCNPHHGLQMHPLEKMIEPHDTIDVTSENLFSRLNAIETELKLKKTDFGALTWLRELDASRSVSRTGDFDDVYATRLTRDQARRGPWPTSELLLTQAACDRIARLYAKDIHRYRHTRAMPGHAETPPIQTRKEK